MSDFWNDIGDPDDNIVIERTDNENDAIVLIRAPPNSSLELSPQTARRVLKPRARGRGRGRGRARARGAPVAVRLPEISEDYKIVAQGAKYKVEYFGGDRLGTSRVLEFKFRSRNNMRCECQGPNAFVRTYAQIGSVEFL